MTQGQGQGSIKVKIRGQTKVSWVCSAQLHCVLVMFIKAEVLSHLTFQLGMLFCCKDRWE